MIQETAMPDAMKDPIWQTLREKIALQNENAELKRLLQLAMDSMANVRSCINCEYKECSCYNCIWKWQHAAEAERLLGGGESDA